MKTDSNSSDRKPGMSQFRIDELLVEDPECRNKQHSHAEARDFRDLEDVIEGQSWYRDSKSRLGRKRKMKQTLSFLLVPTAAGIACLLVFFSLRNETSSVLRATIARTAGPENSISDSIKVQWFAQKRLLEVTKGTNFLVFHFLDPLPNEGFLTTTSGTNTATLEFFGDASPVGLTLQNQGGSRITYDLTAEDKR
jgi:hypothetical protein